ncbi:MAG: acyltransferase family protein [Acutalibacteraceae bacterium]
MARKHWIDNIRILCILILIPFHAVMIFNDLGEKYYINTYECTVASIFNFSVYPWWMSGLFVISGISTRYALKKRTTRQYIADRFRKLFIPLISGLLLIIPIQCFLADKFHNNYSGNYLQHFKRFFTITDLSGADGCFTFGQLWFILYLFLISIMSIPIIKKFKKTAEPFIGIKLILVGILPAVINPLGNIGGKSITEFWLWFLIGYFILSMNEVQSWIQQYMVIWFIISLVTVAVRGIFYVISIGDDSFWFISTVILQWFGILAMCTFGMYFLDKKFIFTDYLSKASFPIYIFHQTFIVAVGYFAALQVKNALLQYMLIISLSFLLTIITYEITKRFKLTRFLFGIKK